MSKQEPKNHLKKIARIFQRIVIGNRKVTAVHHMYRSTTTLRTWLVEHWKKANMDRSGHVSQPSKKKR